MDRMRVLCLIAVLGVFGFLAGCSESNNGAPTPQDVKNFKGGTPPPEVAKKIQEEMSNAAAKASTGSKVIK